MEDSYLRPAWAKRTGLYQFFLLPLGPLVPWSQASVNKATCFILNGELALLSAVGNAGVWMPTKRWPEVRTTTVEGLKSQLSHSVSS